MRTLWVFPIAVGVLLTGCATLPTGPNVLVLPGSGKEFDEFQLDDAVCRQWASQQVGTTKKQAATEAPVTGAVVGTSLGGAGGAAVGAAAGSPATGAAVGSGVETAAGAECGAGAEWRLQRRYDMAYMQCMYAKGNLIPVRESFQQPPTSAQPGSSAPPPLDVPPPPPGNPPPTAYRALG